MTTVTQENPPRELTLAERIGAKPPQGVKYLNAIFYAEPGGGKTHLFGTCEYDPDEFLPALAIDIDGGAEDTYVNKFMKIDIKSVRSMDALKELYKEIAADPYYYKAISLDNISELQKIDMNEVMVEAKRTAQNPDNVDIYVPSQREWGKSGERMRIIIRAFRDLPCHTICLAHIDEKEDKSKGGIMRLWPGMPGKLRHELSGFFSVVGYLSVYEATVEGGGKQQFRQIQFTKTNRVQAKDRFAVLPGLMTENPTLPQIWKIIKESGAQLKDEVDPLQVTASPFDALKSAVATTGGNS